MDGIIYLTLEQAEQIHRKTITYSGGGTYEPLDVGKLDSVLQHIQNDLYYPTFVDKLTHLFFCTCEFHCFADGNKRLAITLSLNRKMQLNVTLILAVIVTKQRDLKMMII